MKAAVVGAGIGGLAAAARLAAAGFEVVVYEKNAAPGGKMSELRAAGFRFDTGPSLLTLPSLLEELFRDCGEEMAGRIPCTELECNCKYFFPDGSDFSFYADRSRLERELAGKGFGTGERLFRRLETARAMYETGAPVFLFSDFHKLSNFNTPPYRRAAARLADLDFMRTMHRANVCDLRNDRLVRVFDRYATYNGSDPYRAPATLNMIAHLENNLGACFPRRGMYSVARELHTLASEQGAEFRFGTQVTGIATDRGRATGVQTTHGTERCDVVVSDADVRYLSEHLLERHPLRRRLRRAEPSSSAVIFYWGAEGVFDGLELHNIVFSEDYAKEFADIFRRHTLPEDPTIYVFVSCKAVPEDSPDGCSNLFVMVNAPADSGQDWDTVVRSARERILTKLKRRLGIDLSGRILTEHVATPVTIERDTFSAGGALYGTSSNTPLAAFLRHPNSLRAYGGLYFVGGSVHPGGGIPLCLAGAKTVCNEIIGNHGGA